MAFTCAASDQPLEGWGSAATAVQEAPGRCGRERNHQDARGEELGGQIACRYAPHVINDDETYELFGRSFVQSSDSEGSQSLIS